MMKIHIKNAQLLFFGSDSALTSGQAFDDITHSEYIASYLNKLTPSLWVLKHCSSITLTHCCQNSHLSALYIIDILSFKFLALIKSTT